MAVQDLGADEVVDYTQACAALPPICTQCKLSAHAHTACRTTGWQSMPRHPSTLSSTAKGARLSWTATKCCPAQVTSIVSLQCLPHSMCYLSVARFAGVLMHIKGRGTDHARSAANEASWQGSQRYCTTVCQPDAELLSKACRYLESGQIKQHVSGVYPFAQAKCVLCHAWHIACMHAV